jgi:hypothetical protein
MPFTPFHFGPGLLVKGLAPARFSWAAFAATQVVIDCETLYYMAHREYPIHRDLHTFVGATVAGLGTSGMLLGIRQLVPGLVRRTEDSVASIRSEISTLGILAGGIIGGVSHPLLDGLMHPDIRPFAPWTDANPLLGAVGLGALHLGCVVAGLIGLMLLWVRMDPVSR